MDRVTPPDLEDWLTGYLRSEFPEAQVGNKEPSDLGKRLPLAKPVIVVRDDSGPRLDYTTFDRSVGVSVLAGSRANDKPANDLARSVAAVLFDLAIATAPGSPIASVDMGGCNGPYPVVETLDVARRYMTAQYTVIGSH